MALRMYWAFLITSLLSAAGRRSQSQYAPIPAVRHNPPRRRCIGCNRKVPARQPGMQLAVSSEPAEDVENRMKEAMKIMKAKNPDEISYEAYLSMNTKEISKVLDEKAKELRKELRGCSLFVTGLGAGEYATKIGKIVAKRLKYDFKNVPDFMTRVYSKVLGKKEDASLQAILQHRPLEEVENVSHQLMDEVYGDNRRITVVWEGAVRPRDFSMMHMGIIVSIEPPSGEKEIALPAEESVAVLGLWRQMHGEMDLKIRFDEEMPFDVAALKFMNDLAWHIETNPPKSLQWLKKREELMKDEKFQNTNINELEEEEEGGDEEETLRKIRDSEE